MIVAGRRDRVPRSEPTDPLTLQQVEHVLGRQNAPDPRLSGIDRCLTRWSVSQGSGLPLSAQDAECLPPSKATPLPDHESVIVDYAICQARAYYRQFVHLWYRSNLPAEAIGMRLGMSRAAVYNWRNVVLGYFQAKLEERGLVV